MNNGIYAASTSLLARTQELDMAANNLANANTTGFRGERVSFRTRMMNASANTSTQAVGSFGILGSPRRLLAGIIATDRQLARPRPGR